MYLYNGNKIVMVKFFMSLKVIKAFKIREL